METTIRVGIVGLGTVGSSVFRILKKDAKLIYTRTGVNVVITAVSARKKDRDDIDLHGVEWFSDPIKLVKSDEVDVVVELIGGSKGIAFDVISAAIKSGKRIVTANKALVALRSRELYELLQNNPSSSLYYEACVAGGIPAVKILREGLVANRVKSIYGILSGTCNYILSEMEKTGGSFKEILKEAQIKGYAESDSTLDVTGVDAAHKLSILSSLAFGIMPDFKSIKIKGICNITLDAITTAADRGCKLRLLAAARRTREGIEQSVEVRELSGENPLSKVEGVTNAVFYKSSYAGDILITGMGAGGDATASAVIADIIDIARGSKLPLFKLRQNPY